MTLTVNSAGLIGASATREVERTSSKISESVDSLSSGTRLSLESGEAGTRAIAARVSSTNAALVALQAPLDLARQATEMIEATADTIQDMVIRLKALAVAASSQNLSDFERALMDAEFQALVSEIDRAANDTELNGVKVTASGPPPQLIEEDFEDAAALPTDLVLREDAAIVGGALELTEAAANERGALIGDTEFVSTGGFETTFTYDISGGSGADGLAVFFVDGDQYDANTTALGDTGGGLMYRNIPFGVFAVGFDEFGNFTNAADGWADGIGFQPDTIGLRLGATSPVAYSLADQMDVTALGGVEGTSTVNITVDSDFAVNVQVDFGNGFENILSAQLDATLVPERLKFGFGASTGGATNFHRINEVELIAQADPSGTFPEVGVDVKVGDGILDEDTIRLPLANYTAEGLLLHTTDIRTQAAAERAIRRTEFAIDFVSEGRAVIAASGFVTQAAEANLAKSLESYEEAETRLVATDVAAEITRLAMHQITLTGGISVLADAVESIEQQFATILPPS